jgi:flavin-binding protein dodecin
MVYKLIEIIGKSDKGLTEAAQNAVEVASQTIKAIQWVEIEKFSMKIEDGSIKEYRARTKIAFEVRPEFLKK